MNIFFLFIYLFLKFYLIITLTVYLSPFTLLSTFRWAGKHQSKFNFRFTTDILWRSSPCWFCFFSRPPRPVWVTSPQRSWRKLCSNVCILPPDGTKRRPNTLSETSIRTQSWSFVACRCTRRCHLQLRNFTL